MLIASPGGHPKDINLYQAQKALGHAARVTRQGGTIILVAACPEGTGSRSYEDWVTGMASHQAVLERFQREGFRIGPHKAFQIARDAAPRRVLMVTQMPPELVRKLLLTPCASLEAALADRAPGPRSRRPHRHHAVGQCDNPDPRPGLAARAAGVAASACYRMRYLVAGGQMTNHFLWVLALLTLPVAAAERKFDFSEVGENHLPPGFRSTVTGQGKPGDWRVIMDDVPPLLQPLTARGVGGGQTGGAGPTGPGPHGRTLPPADL